MYVKQVRGESLKQLAEGSILRNGALSSAERLKIVVRAPSRDMRSTLVRFWKS